MQKEQIGEVAMADAKGWLCTNKSLEPHMSLKL